MSTTVVAMKEVNQAMLTAVVLGGEAAVGKSSVPCWAFALFLTLGLVAVCLWIVFLPGPGRQDGPVARTAALAALFRNGVTAAIII